MDKTTFLSALIMHGFKLIQDTTIHQLLSRGKGNSFNPSAGEKYVEVSLTVWGRDKTAHPIIEIKSNVFKQTVYMNYENAYEHLTSGEDKYVY
ncbi:MAG: hypothetical protein DRQ42_06110 [Gammaproteobacteria bacterium]|nr:MAG: hypothetical protein DRQ42_06110 [Gammaproteobacteria bacterium]